MFPLRVNLMLFPLTLFTMYILILMGWTLIAMVLTMTKTHTISLIYSLHDYSYQILVHINAYTFEFIDDIDSYIDITTCCAK
jgi:hypothetical protein